MDGIFKSLHNKNIDLLINSNGFNKSSWQIKEVTRSSEVSHQQVQTVFILRPGQTYTDNIESNFTSYEYDFDLLYRDIIAATTISTSLSASSDSNNTSQHINSTFPLSTTPLLPNSHLNNYWALLALILVIGTAAGNILVCLAIAWERRLQNVTNYFLMSLAITDLMVAVLVMPLGILTLVKGKW